MLKIERIKVMERIRKEITKIDELAEDIAANGLLNPITVMLLGNEEYRLLAGLRRLKAVISRGLDEIDVSIVAPADAEAELRIEISENEQREPFTFSEQMDFARLLEEIEREKAKERLQAGQSKGGKTAGNGRSKDESCSPPPRAESKSNKETRNIVAKKIGMGKTNYDCAKYIAENAPDEIIEELDKGKRKIRPTYDELKEKEKGGKSKQLSEPVESAILPEHDVVLETEQSNEVKAIDDDKDITVPDTTVPDAADKAPPSAKEQAYAKSPSLPTTSKSTKTKPLKEPPESYMSEQDKEAMRKIREFSAMSPEEKITELQRQLKEERARAAGAESDLARLKELHNNEKLHNRANVNNLKMQIDSLDSELTTALARIKELEDKYEPK